MQYTMLLTATHRLKLEVYFWIYLKLLIRFGTRHFYSNLNLLKSVESSNRFQSVLLNGQECIWLPIKAGVPQRSILSPLLFLIYINDLPDGLNSIAKLFTDDTSLFSVVQDPNESAKYLNLDLTVVSQRAYQWKMLVNLDPKNPAEVIFSSKKNEETHPSVFYNNIFKSTWV